MTSQGVTAIRRVIEKMMEKKKALAESIIGSCESWLTELDTGQLRELFALRPDALDG
ncbi:SNF2/RAD54 family helicase [Desulforamulus profundi]|uniref:SNF2/RAD54 family helicase n=1 Tax=Desulforamulus profundi TaxID=1383067 RepID=A0A2C6L1X8_9FIRM|nr:hypothetical protein [Desulforamulus profundi]PHJ37531.1 SNF2/RAD54 family helicase [Desulforamulus profundi]